MMSAVRWRRISLLGLVLACLMVAVPVLAIADSVTTTGNATSISSTRVVLNGVVNPSYTDNAWFFQYTTSPNFGAGTKATAPVAVGSGLHVVSATVRGLRPGTRYYYRVGVVAQPYTSASVPVHLGDTASFTTLPGAVGKGYGTAWVVHTALPVSGGRVRVVLGCRGRTGARCAGRVGLISQSRSQLLACGVSRFQLAAPHRVTLTMRPSPTCLALVRRVHRAPAAFIGVFSTRQVKLAELVTLLG